ncbi:hypothetical protein FB45DRAFT_750887, partial [Roridomyces roridus]
MAHIPPIVNRLNHLSFNAATRLATLPPSNPLQKLTRRCVSHVPRCHRSVLHDTFSAFPSLTNLETIVPSVLETTWTPSFSHQIATDKNTAIKELSNYSEDLCIFSDGSGYKGGIGAAAVVKQGSDYEARTLHLGSESRHTVFEGELVGMILGLSIISDLPRARSATILVDNQAAIQSVSK